ncbi:unnamed protein product [Larinioides sclopetarius]|uniref:Uncharacterized protein n=1 Tax=Larinioides sclopetarius TaxID=280406 RepID=A0AAV1ZBL0_9ARAC
MRKRELKYDIYRGYLHRFNNQVFLEKSTNYR